MTLIEITPFQLVLCLIFVAVAGTGSVVLRLGLERDLLWGTVRTFAQLYLMGYLLEFVFALDHAAPVLALFGSMIFWAVHAIRGRVGESQIRFVVPTFLSMLVSYMLVNIVVTSVIVRVEPWYAPQYFIPLGGMIVGNAMNAITIALERLFSELRQGRGQIELALCLGATYGEATEEMMRNVIKAGMIPSINALMTVGLVALPGMMTGQILAGAQPLTAIKYQIVVMLMLVASTAMGTIAVVHLVRKRCFTRSHQMIID